MMNKRNLTNIALLVFIVIAASVAIFDSNDDDTEQAITSLEQNDILNITVKRAGKKNIYLEKKHNLWRLKRPYNTATNQFRMDTLLRLVTTIPKSTYPLKNVSQYGLNEPKLEVEFNTGKSNAASIKFGDSDPIKMRRYISVGNKLHLTNDTFFYALNSIATDYIHHKLLPESFEITQLDLPNLKLKIKDEQWEVKPEPKDFSVDNVNELIAEWQNAQAVDIKPYTIKTSFPRNKMITLYGKDASTFTFFILDSKEDFILVDKLKGLKYSFAKEKEDKLLQFPTIPIAEDNDENKEGN